MIERQRIKDLKEEVNRVEYQIESYKYKLEEIWNRLIKLEEMAR